MATKRFNPSNMWTGFTLPGVVNPADGTTMSAFIPYFCPVASDGTELATGAGGMAVNGGAASGATAVGNPVRIGGIFNTTQPTVTTGQAVDFQATNRGELLVRPSFAAVAALAAADNADGVATTATIDKQVVVARQTKFNGTSWDRDRKPTSVARLVSAAATTNATNVKASAGDVHRIYGFNASAAKKYLKLYNKATAPVPGTDTPVLTLTCPVGAFAFDLGGEYFATGIGYALTGAGADADTTALAAGDIESLNIVYV